VRPAKAEVQHVELARRQPEVLDDELDLLGEVTVFVQAVVAVFTLQLGARDPVVVDFAEQGIVWHLLLEDQAAMVAAGEGIDARVGCGGRMAFIVSCEICLDARAGVGLLVHHGQGA
jgi:hypothetical protein